MKFVLQNIKIRLIQINTLQYKNRAIKFVNKINPETHNFFWKIILIRKNFSTAPSAGAAPDKFKTPKINKTEVTVNL